MRKSARYHVFNDPSEAWLHDLTGSSPPRLLHQSALLGPSATVVFGTTSVYVISKARRIIRFGLEEPFELETWSLDFPPASADLLDDRLLAHDLSTATVRLLDLHSLKPLTSLDASVIGTVSTMRANADATRLAIGSMKGQVAIFSLSTGELLASERISGAAVTSLLWSGDRLESATADGRHFEHDLVGRKICSSLQSVLSRCETHVRKLASASLA